MNIEEKMNEIKQLEEYYSRLSRLTYKCVNVDLDKVEENRIILSININNDEKIIDKGLAEIFCYVLNQDINYKFRTELSLNLYDKIEKLRNEIKKKQKI